MLKSCATHRPTRRSAFSGKTLRAQRTPRSSACCSSTCKSRASRPCASKIDTEMRLKSLFLGLVLVCAATCASAQDVAKEDTRTQYPSFLANSFFTVNVGSMRYIFSDDQLAPGFHADSIGIPHLAAR